MTTLGPGPSMIDRHPEDIPLVDLRDAIRQEAGFSPLGPVKNAAKPSAVPTFTPEDSPARKKYREWVELNTRLGNIKHLEQDRKERGPERAIMMLFASSALGMTLSVLLQHLATMH